MTLSTPPQALSTRHARDFAAFNVQIDMLMRAMEMNNALKNKEEAESMEKLDGHDNCHPRGALAPWRSRDLREKSWIASRCSQ